MTKIIFFDSDCISSFLWTKREDLLYKCFGKNMIIPIQVYSELSRVSFLKKGVDSLINDNYLEIKELSEAQLVEYLNLTDVDRQTNFPLIGHGEAAAIILAKDNNGILASNNLRDIKFYIKTFNLKYLMTQDIIDLCVERNFLSLDEANLLWLEMIRKKRKLPTSSYYEYLETKKIS